MEPFFAVIVLEYQPDPGNALKALREVRSDDTSPLREHETASPDMEQRNSRNALSCNPCPTKKLKYSLFHSALVVTLCILSSPLNDGDVMAWYEDVGLARRNLPRRSRQRLAVSALCRHLGPSGVPRRRESRRGPGPASRIRMRGAGSAGRWSRVRLFDSFFQLGLERLRVHSCGSPLGPRRGCAVSSAGEEGSGRAAW